MRVEFRQGIARYQTDIGANATFLQKSSLNAQFIDLIVSPDPTIVVFAHKTATYVYEEVKTVRNAWGPFAVGGPTVYLYWDLSLINGVVTRGVTQLPPHFSAVSPTTPAPDQHWFDTVNTVMKVWDGTKWVEKVRVFAATYINSATIRPYPLGSQAGLNTTVNAGNIVLDTYGKPLRMSDGTFATTTSQLSVVGLATKQVKLEAEVLHLMAAEEIPRYCLVQVRPGRRAVLARHTDVMSRVQGLAVEDLHENEVGTIVTSGLVRSELFTWTDADVNRPIFCGPNGELTTTPVSTGVIQQVGSVWDNDAVMINIFPPIVLDDPFTVAPPIPPVPGAPVASFSSVPALPDAPVVAGVVPLSVTFQDTSTNSPTAIEWDFTNDGVVDSTSSNPSYTFVAPGTYTIRMRAINSLGSNEVLKTIQIDPQANTGTNVNLEVTIGGPAQVKRNTTFSVNVLVRNEGLQTATNVVRTISIPDVSGQQVTLNSIPPGATVNRVGTVLYITLPTIPAIPTDNAVNSVISIIAPPLPNKTIVIYAEVDSPELDSTPGDDSVSLAIQVTP